MYNLCAFFVRSGSCREGDRCRFVHGLTQVGFQVKAHEASIRAVDMVSMPDGPRLITGSVDKTVKIWNLTQDPPTQEMVKETAGTIGTIAVDGTTIMWAVDEPLAGDAPGIPVGMVHLLDNNTGTTMPIHKSADLPYTHPREIRAMAIVSGSPYVITSGGEGVVTVWQYSGGKFQEQHKMEGHTRPVASLVVNDTMVWSASADRTIRVWDIAGGKCVGTIGSAPANPNGHSDTVICLTKIPKLRSDGETYICSGGLDCSVKLWKANGEFAFSCTNPDKVSALEFCDDLGGLQTLLIGLQNGTIIVRSCASMGILFKLENTICRTQCVWAIKSLGHSCFASGGDDGQMVMWRVLSPMQDSQQTA